MNNKKGFTLTELLAVIVILGILLTISVLGISRIKKNIDNSNQQNLISLIIAEAKKYNQETGIKKVSVLTLLEKGRIEADGTDNEGLPYLNDPASDEKLTCGYVDFTTNNKGKFYKTGGCVANLLTSNKISVSYKYKDKNGVESPITVLDPASGSPWFAMASGESLVLIATPENEDSTSNYSWTNPYLPDEEANTKEYTITAPATGIINDTFILSFISNGKEEINEFKLRVDSRKPQITDVYVDESSPAKSIRGKISDAESGLSGYALVDSPSCVSVTYTNVTENSKEINLPITRAKVYYLCVKDKAGNEALSDKIEVKSIDGLAPVLKLNIQNGSNYTKTKTATISVEDPTDEYNIASGINLSQITVKYAWSKTAKNCNELTSTAILNKQNPEGTLFEGNITINGGNGAGKLYVCTSNVIKDVVGNTIAATPVSGVMNLDNTPPNGKLEIVRDSSYSYNSRKVIYTMKDVADTENNSGLQVCVSDSNSYCTSWSTNINQKNISYAFYGNTDPMTFPHFWTHDGREVSLYLHIKDSAGNLKVVNGKYKFYNICDVKKSNRNCGICVLTFGLKWEKYCVITYTDRYLDFACPGVDDEWVRC